MTAETIEHVAQLFEEHGSIIWWQREAKDLLPEGFTHPGSPNGNLQKKQISWTSGLTRVHHGMGLWLTVQNSNIQLIFTWKVLTNTVVGSTHLLSLCGEPWCSALQTNLVSRFCL